MKPFIITICILISFLTTGITSFSQGIDNRNLLIESQDSIEIKRVFSDFKTDKELPIGELMTEIGKSFMKAPYVSQTLETGGREIMIINLRQFDCTTFAENCLAFARCIKQDKISIAGFISELRKIRYRNGELDTYCSRLHYFSEWIANNEQKGLVTQPADALIAKLPVNVDFMSEHPDSYPALYENPQLVPLIVQIEDSISARSYQYLPQTEIASHEELLKEGDIVGITTSISGLDIAHVGMITFVDGRAHLLHASSSSNKVVVSDKTLSNFLLSKRLFTGVMIARPKNL